MLPGLEECFPIRSFHAPPDSVHSLRHEGPGLGSSNQQGSKTSQRCSWPQQGCYLAHLHLVLSTTVFCVVSSVLSPGRVLYSKALLFESLSHFSLTEPMFKRHFPSHLFFLSKVLSSSFSSAHFLAEHIFGGVFFLELSVAMAKCSSQPCFSMDKLSWALWVEAG